MMGRLHGRGGNGTALGLVIGLTVGILAVALAAPDEQRTEVAASGERAATVGDGLPRSGGDGAVGGAGDGVGAAATSTGGIGGTAGRSGAGGRGGGGASAQSAGAAPSGPVQGVTADKVVIGVAWPDISALKALGPAYDNGDPPSHWRALVDNWRRQGVLPVAGRDIELKFRSYNALNNEEQRAACAGLVSDDKAFAVVGQTFFYVGSECVAREFKTPLLTSDGPSDEVFQRSHPNLFSLSASQSRHLRNFIHWANDKGHLAGRKIGIYYLNDAVNGDLMDKTVKAELKKLGHELAAEQTTGQDLGGPQDALTVQRFRTAGVEVALLFTSKSGFMQQANAQGYKPRYLDSDYFFGTSDTATSQYPADQFDGSSGITGRRVGETSAGIPLGAEGDACVANYERFSETKLQKETAEWAYVLTTCDLGKVVLLALRAAGRALTRPSYIAGMESLRSLPMLRYSPVSFTAGRHHGGDRHRTVKWAAACRCWRAEGAFAPLYVE